MFIEPSSKWVQPDCTLSIMNIISNRRRAIWLFNITFIMLKQAGHLSYWLESFSSLHHQRKCWWYVYNIDCGVVYSNNNNMHAFIDNTTSLIMLMQRMAIWRIIVNLSSVLSIECCMHIARGWFGGFCDKWEGESLIQSNSVSSFSNHA
jgi:hypothetical protein